MGLEPEQCDYCFRPPVATIKLVQSPMRLLLRLPARRRLVCIKHLKRDVRPGGRYA